VPAPQPQVRSEPGTHRLFAYVNSNLAREAGRLYEWKEKFWGRRYQAIVVSNEEEAQIDRLEYILSNSVKEGLVERPQDWPGAHSVGALLTGEPLEGLCSGARKTAQRRPTAVIQQE
jgi:hypothetical protein